MTSSTTPTTVEVVAPITGTIIDITDVPDPVLSKKSVGDGFGISAPPGGTVVSPVTGTVIMVAKTLHAVGFKTESGLQFLVHLGIDTVELEGKPFTLTIAKGDEVKAGQNIGTMDVEAIKEGGKDTTTVVTVTNTTKKLDHIDVNTGPAETGDKVAVAYVKAEPPVLQAAPTPKELTPAENPNRPAELTGYDALAWDIIDNIGGKENVRSVTYCITRVRFYLKDSNKAKTDIITNLNGVLDVVQAGGQYQVVVGPEAEEVYNAVMSQLGETSSGDAETEAAKSATALDRVKSLLHGRPQEKEN
ncbi:glucose PTS transporter subunit IIA [Corynebacterium matruchotii]|uniref:glucose PTS transporter subunit IIA n=1 Tax=Corynebacterium matruchotii TaxID=43768 RepID=UPI003C701710